MSQFVIHAASDELIWLKHAAKLAHISVSEYVKEAINTRLRKEGVDAVCFAVKSER